MSVNFSAANVRKYQAIEPPKKHHQHHGENNFILMKALKRKKNCFFT
jgi:hypothetical protein